MSKNFSIAKLFSAVACLPIVGLSAVACLEIAPKDKENPTSNNSEINQNMSQNGEIIENNTNVNDENNTVYALNGVYSYANNLSVNDIVYDDLNSVLNYFNVRNLASAKNELLKLGFSDFIKNITEKDGSPVSVIFFNNSSSSGFRYASEVDGSYRFDGDIYQFTATEDGYVVDDDSVLLSFDSEKNEVTMLYQFTYSDEKGNLIETPIYLKTTLSFVNGTDTFYQEQITSYAYTAETAKITASEENYEVAESILKEKLEVGEDKDVFEAIESMFSYEKSLFNYNNESQLIIYSVNGEEYETNTILSIHNGVFTLFGLDFSIQELDDKTGLKFVANLGEAGSFEMTLHVYEI